MGERCTDPRMRYKEKDQGNYTLFLFCFHCFYSPKNKKNKRQNWQETENTRRVIILEYLCFHKNNMEDIFNT